MGLSTGGESTEMLMCYLNKGHTLTCTQKHNIVQIAVQAINILAKLLLNQNNPQKRDDGNEVRLHCFGGTLPAWFLIFFSPSENGWKTPRAEEPILE